MLRFPSFFLATPVVSLVLFAGSVSAQTAPVALPKQVGTVKAVSARDFTLTTAAGQDVVVAVPVTAKVLVVAPGSKDLKSATAGALADVGIGDKALVTGTTGDTAVAMVASRVVLMKSAAIAESHAADEAAWAQGGGGIVKTVDAGAGTVVVMNGAKTLAVQTSAKTIVRHYSGDSVRFQDATVGTLAAVRPGDQLRVRGAKSADGSAIVADEIVTGTFHNYSGLVTSIDATAGTVTLKDLATKHMVVVAVTGNSDVHRLPAAMGQRLASQLKGTAAGGAAASAATGGDAARRTSRAGSDLSSMMARLPTETLGGMKAGEAVMIVATSPADSSKATAVTLLVGVDAILTASPGGETMTLSPWSLGGGSDAGGGQ